MCTRHCAALVHTWEAWQVELHGKYSVERMHSFQTYSRRASLAHALLVIFLSPLLCILSVILVDLIPLQAPEKGLAHSHAFWLRIYFSILCVYFAILEQARHYIPALHITGLQVVLVTFFVAAGAVANAFGWACLIGYPLPFFPCFAAPAGIFLTAITGTMLWGKHVRGKPAVLTEIMTYANIVVGTISLIFIYPPYNYVFISLPSSQQTAFALLLPVLKILAKNAIAYLTRHLEDFKPEIVIFNVEIFHALFVANCTQQSNSIFTTILLMAMDFLQACASLHDIDLMLNSLRKLIYTDPAPAGGHQTSTRPSNQSRISPLDAAMYILAIDPHLRFSEGVRLHSQATISSVPQSIVIRRHQDSKPGPGDTAISSTVGNKSQLLGNKLGFRRNSSKMSVAVYPETFRSRSASVEVILDAHARTTHISDADKQRLQLLSPESRLQVVQETLQLLHLAEFLLLIEFTEVIVPCIFCVFVGVVSHLPNQQFYSNLRDLDDTAVWTNIGKILAYATLEAISFAMLAYLLQRKLRMSSLKQLAFVLETQWQLVQSKLILWVITSLQTTLVHVGMDYSLRFAWLHNSN